GGWPLNCICLPDQRPVYGGTYFRTADWVNVLTNVANLWANEPEKALEYADRLTAGIRESEKIVTSTSDSLFTTAQLTEIVKPWKKHFDMEFGGYNRAPKFPLPNNWLFLLRYGVLAKDKACYAAVQFTLEEMAKGGIYDQIAGGFARYSVDDKWHVPHFEKMLYDNAQLISLYLEAYQSSKNESFKQVAKTSIQWVFNEMTSAEGMFFSALDADSEGVEGKFYVWDKSEFDETIGIDAELMGDYYDVTESGNWEEEQTNILRRTIADDIFFKKHKIDKETLNEKTLAANEKLLARRSKRIRPGLDDKCLTAWNGMMIKALVDAASILDDSSYYEKAVQTTEFILNNLRTEDSSLFRNYKNGKASIGGFLDDYAFLIEALITLYQFDFDEKWLNDAKKMIDFVIAYFTDADSPMFFYTSSQSEKLIARKHEVMDNVIPASNSTMANNLMLLGLLFDDESYTRKADEMLKSVQPSMKSYGSAYSNWGITLVNKVYGINEIAIVGEEYERLKTEFGKHYIPNKIMLGGTNSTLPLLEGKEGLETKAYICKNRICQLPVSAVADALNHLH
ncbi:MAG: thioredoxin domain-containing protein, partial [Pedobacter sp.]|nr:thioredoxin domain-containing protein [Pedobacter sp.]